MDDRDRIAELAEAVEMLAHAVEKLASRHGDFTVTGHAQVAREKALRAG